MRNWWLKRKLRKFFRTQPDSSALVRTKTIAREPRFFGYGAEEVATALMELMEEDLIWLRYQLLRPDGSIMGWSFLDPRDIPDTIFDMELDKQVETAPMDIETVFVVNPYVSN